MTSLQSEETMAFLRSCRISIISVLIIIGVLRLTNFNFYLSQVFGFETEINATGGKAFNFSNYASIAVLLGFLFIKGRYINTRWRSLGPYALLLVIYTVNALFAPYANSIWYLYQVLFILLALITHIYIRKRAGSIESLFRPWMPFIFWGLMIFMGVCLVIILSQVSLTDYLTNFNESFVQSLDDFGVMKQRHGYLLGFLVSCTLFLPRPWVVKVFLLFCLLFAGFGIRSFVLGLIGAGAIFSVRDKKTFVLFISATAIGVYLIFDYYLNNLIFDTRFYSYYNAWDIIHQFPLGVGLGGYPVYTEEFSRNLFAQFYNVNAALDFVPAAPESDLVHIFGSLGLWAGLVHIVIQLRLVWLTYQLQDYCSSGEKLLLFYFCFMTFFGISEDSMFSVNYWIFFGVASGILSAVLYRVKIM